LAVVLTKAHHVNDARKLLARAVRQYPQSADLHFQFGLVQIATENFEEASAALQTALRLGLSGDQAQRAKQELDALQQQGRAG
jgi:thioredoxin-like negative regulator of GroEL